MIESKDRQPTERHDSLSQKRLREESRGVVGFGPWQRLWIGLSWILLLHNSGCGIAPKSFKSLSSPAAIVRARSVAYGNNLPDARVIPPLIDRLNDTDPVVRLTAYEELKKRTGQDFGFVPWGPPEERVQAVERWKRWWAGQKPAMVRNRQNP